MFLNENKANPAFLQTVLDAQDKRGKMLSSFDGTEYMISYVKSDRLGWSFISVTDYDKLLSKVDTLKKIYSMGNAGMSCVDGGHISFIYQKHLCAYLQPDHKDEENIGHS